MNHYYIKLKIYDVMNYNQKKYKNKSAIKIITNIYKNKFYLKLKRL